MNSKQEPSKPQSGAAQQSSSQQQPDQKGAASQQPGQAGGPEMQGEGNYTAARRHRESVEEFVESGQVDKAAREAKPRSDREAQELRDAEAAGRAPARK